MAFHAPAKEQPLLAFQSPSVSCQGRQWRTFDFDLESKGIRSGDGLWMACKKQHCPRRSRAFWHLCVSHFVTAAVGVLFCVGFVLVLTCDSCQQQGMCLLWVIKPLITFAVCHKHATLHLLQDVSLCISNDETTDAAQWSGTGNGNVIFSINVTFFGCLMSLIFWQCTGQCWTLNLAQFRLYWMCLCSHMCFQ